MTATWARRRILVVLTLFVVVAMAVNLRKPFHIDDAAYLQIAKAILVDPLHPLSQEINWGSTTEPIFVINQPLLIPYIYAALIGLFGPSELVLHFFIALCSALVVFCFHRLLLLFRVSNSLFVTGLCILGPAFLPGQNVMVDVPLLASWLTFYLALLIAATHKSRYLLAGIAVAVACLIKYTSLLLLPVLPLMIVYRRHWQSLWVAGIPVLTMLLWAAFNYYDVGAIHLFARPSLTLTPQIVAYRLIGWLAGVGSIAPFIISFVYLDRRDILDRRWLMVSGGGGALFYLFTFLTDNTAGALVWAAFFGAGVFLNGIAGGLLARHLTAAWKAGDKETVGQDVVLGWWIAGATAFIILWAPFMAIRHVLLVLPPFLILLGRSLTRRGVVVIRDVVSCGVTCLLGLALAISDYVSADIYRAYPYIIKASLPSNERVYQAGHWGWGWYARDAGMIQYDTEKSRLGDGDYLVIPTDVASQEYSPDHLSRLHQVRRISVPAPLATWLRTMDGGGYYAFGFPRSTPWKLSRAPFEFVIYRVGG